MSSDLQVRGEISELHRQFLSAVVSEVALLFHPIKMFSMLSVKANPKVATQEQLSSAVGHCSSLQDKEQGRNLLWSVALHV